MVDHGRDQTGVDHFKQIIVYQVSGAISTITGDLPRVFSFSLSASRLPS